MNGFSLMRRIAVLAGLSLASAVVFAAGRVRVVEVVSYAQLGNHVGAQIVVRTTLGSRRAGTLVRHTQTALRLRLSPADGGVELDIPSSSVKDVEVLTETEASAGDDSAKKN
ncbi:hypothetical protein [Tahibacter harae]|uniref:Uncharacterized protein n=1 Tax=Tahibacter harae TaxID=2963937 RepID=A0ABT1QRP0_9GAMM|nr:hypothetical protein [Tahibacter harae]MCQ4164948.1 hypothetical protein [Tahibacter harae]